MGLHNYLNSCIVLHKTKASKEIPKVGVSLGAFFNANRRAHEVGEPVCYGTPSYSDF